MAGIFSRASLTEVGPSYASCWKQYATVLIMFQGQNGGEHCKRCNRGAKKNLLSVPLSRHKSGRGAKKNLLSVPLSRHKFGRGARKTLLSVPLSRHKLFRLGRDNS